MRKLIGTHPFPAIQLAQYDRALSERYTSRKRQRPTGAFAGGRSVQGRGLRLTPKHSR